MKTTFLTPVALAAALACSLSVAQSSASSASTETLERVVIESSADASAGGLQKDYAGGQVARGGRAGILGSKDNLDTPFSITAYTNELIQDTQAKSVADVLQNDPGVRVARGYGNFQEAYFIRGFILTSDDVAYNGLFGLMPRQYIGTELFERVEVLRGASGFLLGASPAGGGIGGNLNLLPKRAQNQDLNRVTIGFGEGGALEESADVSRRFGADKATGLRVNVAHRDGGTGVDHEKNKLDLVSVGLDWRSSNVRLSGDVGYQNNQLQQTRSSVTLGYGVTALPALPNPSTNFAQPWSYSNERDLFGTLRGEVDLSAYVTAWAAFGSHHDSEANSLANFTLTNAATGDGNTNRFDNTREVQTNTGEIGVRGKLALGGVTHEWVLSASGYQSDNRAAYVWDYFNTQNTNLYAPVYSALPAYSNVNMFTGNQLSSPALIGRTELTSFVFGDTLHLLDEKLLLTLGAREQKMHVESFAYDTHAEAAPYDKSRLSPSAAVVYKLGKGLSVYANYIEGLSQGDTYTNGSGATVTLAPYLSKQKEVGLKFDAGRTGFGLALFSTDKPRVLKFGQPAPQGFDRHQGAEFSVYGEAMRGLRVLGGLTLLDTRQENTGDPTEEGKRTLGIPKQQANLGVDWDVAGIEGLSLDARLLYTGGVYADSANTLPVPNWTRLDVGARYVFDVQGKLLTLRGRVDNLANRKYWSSAGGYPDQGYLVIGAPRTLNVSVSADF